MRVILCGRRSISWGWKVQGWEWADMFVVCICVLQWLHIGEVIVCVCALQWFRMSFDHWVSAVCLCGPLPIGVNFSYLKWRQCGEEKRCYGVLKQEVWSGETLCERCRLKHFWHPPHWSTVTVLLWLGCQKWQTHLFFFGVLRSAHVEKKRFFKMGIVETCHTHKFYRHLFFWIIYFFPFETSATASCGYMLLRYTDICYVDSDHEHEKLQALTQLHHFVTSLGLLHSLLSLFGLRRLIFHFCVRSCNGLTSKGMAKM